MEDMEIVGVRVGEGFTDVEILLSDKVIKKKGPCDVCLPFFNCTVYMVLFCQLLALLFVWKVFFSNSTHVVSVIGGGGGPRTLLC